MKYLFNFITCNSILIKLLLSKSLYQINTCEPWHISKVVLNYNLTQLQISPKNIKPYFQCQIIIEIPKSNSLIILFFIQTVEILERTNNSEFFIRFISNNKSIFEKRSNTGFEDLNGLFLTPLFKKFNWNTNILLEINSFEFDFNNLIIIMLPLIKCSVNNATLCYNHHDSISYCVFNQNKCSTLLFCPNMIKDSFKILCSNQNIKSIIIPIFVAIIILILVFWIIYRTYPCFQFNQLIQTNQPISEVLRGYFPTVGLIHNRSVDSSEPKTPANAPYSPPTYGRKQEILSDHHLPPSYTADTDVRITPKFLSRFFGREKDRTITDRTVSDTLNDVVTKK